MNPVEKVLKYAAGIENAKVQKLKAYLKTLYRLARDSMWRFKFKTFLTLFGDFIGIGLQISAIGQAVLYARKLETGKPFKWLGHVFDPHSSLTLLVGCALGFIVTMLISAWVTYASRYRALVLSREYEELCVRRVFRKISASGAGLSLNPSGFVDDFEIMQLVGSDARLCGRSYLRLLIMVVPFWTFISALATLAWTNFSLSLFLLAPGGIFAYYLVNANRLAATSFLGYERSAPGTALEKRSIVNRLKNLSASPDQADEWIQRYFRKGQAGKNLSSYVQFLRTTELSHLINGMLLSVGVFLLLIILGWNAISKEGRWSDLLIYLAAFRYMASSLRQLSANFIALSRFYPQIRRLLNFMEGSTKKERKKAPASPDVGVVRLQAANGPFPGGTRSLTAGTGSVIGIASPVALNRYTIGWMFRQITGNHKAFQANRVWFVSAGYHCPKEVTVRNCLNIEAGVMAEDLLPTFKKTDLYRQWKEEIDAILDKVPNEEQWKEVRIGVKFLLATASVRASDANCVFLDEKGLRNIPSEARKEIVARFTDRIVFIVYTDTLVNSGKFGDSVLAVIDEKGIIGMGSSEWLAANKEKITSWLHEKSAAMANPEREGEGDAASEIVGLL